MEIKLLKRVRKKHNGSPNYRQNQLYAGYSAPAEFLVATMRSERPEEFQFSIPLYSIATPQ